MKIEYQHPNSQLQNNQHVYIQSVDEYQTFVLWYIKLWIQYYIMAKQRALYYNIASVLQHTDLFTR